MDSIVQVRVTKGLQHSSKSGVLEEEVGWETLEGTVDGPGGDMEKRIPEHNG